MGKRVKKKKKKLKISNNNITMKININKMFKMLKRGKLIIKISNPAMFPLEEKLTPLQVLHTNHL
jgi:hypothetical protein